MDRLFTIVVGLKSYLQEYPAIISLLIIIIIYSFFWFLKYLYKKPLEIEDLKLYVDFYLFLFLIILILLTNLLLFCYRIRNFGNQIDLKDIFLNLFKNLYVDSFWIIFYKIFCCIGIILCLLYFFLLIKKLTFLTYCKINFYILFFYGIKKNIKETSYSKFKWDYYCHYFCKIRYAPINLLEHIFGELTFEQSKFILFFMPYYGLLLLLPSFLYDIFFNNYILYSYFFILPISLLYQIAYAIFDAFTITMEDEDKIICNYLYDPIICEAKKEECNFYISSRDEVFTNETLEEIKLYINCNFDRTKFFYEYVRKFNKKPSLC